MCGSEWSEWIFALIVWAVVSLGIVIVIVGLTARAITRWMDRKSARTAPADQKPAENVTEAKQK